jgi:hypothetical protein
VLGLVQLPALAVDCRQSCQRGEVRIGVRGQSTDRERLVVAPERLVDGGALRIELDAVAPQDGRGLEVRQSRREPVEDGPLPALTTNVRFMSTASSLSDRPPQVALARPCSSACSISR